MIFENVELDWGNEKVPIRKYRKITVFHDTSRFLGAHDL